MESGDIVAGDDKGSVRCYSVSVEGEYYMSSEFVAHTSSVNAILVLGDGTIGKLTHAFKIEKKNHENSILFTIFLIKKFRQNSFLYFF